MALYIYCELISICFILILNQGGRSGGVGLEKTLPDEATTKPIILHSMLLFFLFKP
ncbi:MAG: hypothetical protein ACFFCL_09760 [Promethearchaeota archaeon]